MANDHIGVLSHPGHPLAAVDTPKAPVPCKKYGQNPTKIQPHFMTIFDYPKLRWDSDDYSMMTL